MLQKFHSSFCKQKYIPRTIMYQKNVSSLFMNKNYLNISREQGSKLIHQMSHTLQLFYQKVLTLEHFRKCALSLVSKRRINVWFLLLFSCVVIQNMGSLVEKQQTYNYLNSVDFFILFYFAFAFQGLTPGMWKFPGQTATVMVDLSQGCNYSSQQFRILKSLRLDRGQICILMNPSWIC